MMGMQKTNSQLLQIQNPYVDMVNRLKFFPASKPQPSILSTVP